MRVNLTRKFGAHIRSLRRSRKLTQDKLAERSHLSVDAIRRIERGAFSPTLHSLEKLCSGLEISLATLFSTFERHRQDEVAELCDFLMERSSKEIHMVVRLVRALFEEE